MKDFPQLKQVGVDQDRRSGIQPGDVYFNQARKNTTLTANSLTTLPGSNTTFEIRQASPTNYIPQ